MTDPVTIGRATRPVLRWHGGKWKLAPWIISHFPPHRVYVEPFGGAASVLVRKPRSYSEIYNDLDGSVVGLFRVLRSSDAERLVNLLRLTPFARADCPAIPTRSMTAPCPNGEGSSARPMPMVRGSGPKWFG